MSNLCKVGVSRTTVRSRQTQTRNGSTQWNFISCPCQNPGKMNRLVNGSPPCLVRVPGWQRLCHLHSVASGITMVLPITAS